MKELNPLDPYKRGLGAAESLADEIETDEYAAKFQKKFFYNDATPTTLISMPGSSKDQRDRSDLNGMSASGGRSTPTALPRWTAT